MEKSRFENWLQRNKLTPFTFSIYVVIFGIAGFLIIQNIVNKSTVKNDFYKGQYKITTGRILEYSEFGIGPNRYLTYEYNAGTKTYSRQIDGLNRAFPQCDENIKNCEQYRFYVIYSTNDPSKSMIDLTVDLSNSSKPDFPKDLKNFQ